MLSLKTPHCVCFLLDVIVFSLFLGHFLLGAAVQSAHLVYMSSVSVVRASLIFSEPKLKVRRYPFNCASKLARYGFCCSFICWKWKELPRFRFHLRFRYRYRHRHRNALDFNRHPCGPCRLPPTAWPTKRAFAWATSYSRSTRRTPRSWRCPRPTRKSTRHPRRYISCCASRLPQMHLACGASGRLSGRLTYVMSKLLSAVHLYNPAAWRRTIPWASLRLGRRSRLWCGFQSLCRRPVVSTYFLHGFPNQFIRLQLHPIPLLLTLKCSENVLLSLITQVQLIICDVCLISY